jgi:hypothetical protein
MLRLPVPRRLPPDVVPAAGSQVKVLARRHVEALLDAVERRPDLIRFWRRSWIADETFVGSVLQSPMLVQGWAAEHVPADLWSINWGGERRKSPPWLGLADLDRLAAARRGGSDRPPMLFARKFSTATSGALLDAVDSSLRNSVGTDP